VVSNINNLKNYYELTKPGIIYGNALTAIAGFLVASKGHIRFSLLIETILGICLVIASACVFNNYIDQDIDIVMTRTKKRALVEGAIVPTNAILFAGLLGILGFILLEKFTNHTTVIIGVVAFVDYVVLYGFAKRRTIHSTLVGSISGSAPIVAGYCAVTNHFGIGAIILFFILAFWQMSHFYAIAIYRLKDYKAAKLPVLPVKKGIAATKIQIMIYIVAFIAANIALSVFGYTDYAFLIVMVFASSAWFGYGIKGYKNTDNGKWARQMFFVSLFVIMTLSLMLSINKV
jgi:protoheme IX farnesyltransferase